MLIFVVSAAKVTDPTVLRAAGITVFGNAIEDSGVGTRAHQTSPLHMSPCASDSRTPCPLRLLAGAFCQA